MNQHLIRGRGRPTEVPEHYSQLYLDLDTKYHWISTGTSSVDDWLGPLMDLAAVNKALADFANGTGREPGTVAYIPMVYAEPYGRHFTVEVKNRDGRFNIITDDSATSERNKPITMVVDVEQGLDVGTVYSILNETDAEIMLYTTLDVYRFAGQPDREIRFFPGNLANFKLINVLGATRYWLVWGDYDHNADTIGGKTLEELIAAFQMEFMNKTDFDAALEDAQEILDDFMESTAL